MDRREFISFAAAATPAGLAAADRIPSYRVITRHRASASSVPGPFAGRVASVHSERCIDATTDKVDRAAVAEMVAAGMKALTGESNARAAWARFFDASDVVGIKINASGAPNICSAPEVVGEVAANLVAVGVKPENIWVWERNKRQVDTVPYADFLPSQAHVVTADAYLGYDPFTYVDVSFFGEDDTRSNMVRLASDKLTKIVNIPNIKDHGASGVTGCLKNMAYGSFGNVARSHQYADTHTLSFIGTLAAVEPLRSRTVLHINDGLRGIWHGGPFMHQPRFRYYPKQMLFSTDPVASDRVLLDIIEAKRAAEKAISVWDRSDASLSKPDAFVSDPNFNRFKREPGHIEYAGKLGLGVYDKAKIDLREIRL